jgi:tRNA(fMet)-specific endonuclease VapC
LILDTNALAAFVDGDEAVGDVLRHQARACIPVIVLGEFRYGIAQSKHRAAYEQWLRSELDHFEVLAVTAQTTIAYAALRVALKQQGTRMPANNAWIAALALQHKLPVLTRDPHFDAVPGMKRQDW